jgi:methylated-DNA-[protein]-cysteine S-methyltransferase
MADLLSASLRSALPEPTVETERVCVLIPSPLGSLGVEVRGEAITRVVIAPERRHRSRFTPLGEVELTDFLEEVVGRLSEYFAGARKNLDLAYDLGEAQLDPFALRVFEETAKVPYGTTRTYRRIAAAAGRGSAYRAARAILTANPLPILVPCHRIVPQKAGVGTYIAGPKKKDWLLKHERRVIEAEQPAR